MGGSFRPFLLMRVLLAGLRWNVALTSKVPAKIDLYKTQLSKYVVEFCQPNSTKKRRSKRTTRSQIQVGSSAVAHLASSQHTSGRHQGRAGATRATVEALLYLPATIRLVRQTTLSHTAKGAIVTANADARYRISQKLNKLIDTCNAYKHNRMQHAVAWVSLCLHRP